MSSGAQTADRAIDLLLLAAGSEEPLTLAQLGQRAGLTKATTYRLVQSLVRRSLLVREDGGHRYLVGGGLIALCASVMQNVDIRQTARPTLERVAMFSSETVGLHVYHLRERICVDTIQSSHPVREVVPIGETLPLWAGVTGKAILAHLPEPQIAALLDEAAEAGEDTELIRAQLNEVRVRGHLAAVGDRVAGVGGLSVPLFNATGVAGSLTISGPGDRFTLKAMHGVASQAMDACRELSAELGHQPSISAAPTLRPLLEGRRIPGNAGTNG